MTGASSPSVSTEVGGTLRLLLTALRVACAAVLAATAFERDIERVRRFGCAQAIDDARRLDLLAGRSKVEHGAPHEFAHADAHAFRYLADGELLRGSHEYNDVFAGFGRRERLANSKAIEKMFTKRTVQVSIRVGPNGHDNFTVRLHRVAGKRQSMHPSYPFHADMHAGKRACQRMSAI